MRLAETVRFPVVSLAALSLAVGAASIAPREPVVACGSVAVDLESASESIVQREDVRVVQREDAPRAATHHSVWRGTYVCSQGESAMMLTIDIAPGGAATARYDFGATPSNPTVPTGAFLLAGKIDKQVDGSFAGVLDATQWIVHPDNYFMEALSIRSPDGRRLIGKTHHDSCMEFEITRVK